MNYAQVEVHERCPLFGCDVEELLEVVAEGPIDLNVRVCAQEVVSRCVDYHQMVGLLCPVVVESWLVVTLLEAKLFEEELEKEVPFPADGSIALNPTKHFEYVLARERVIDLHFWEVATKPDA